MARLAKSLETLRNQVNAKYPKRSKVSDGWIGDAAHQRVASDHNPNAQGVVTALDITHDPKNGLDVHALADRLLANRHSNLKYIISNRRIAGAWTNWKWQVYSGSNPHTQHAHFSVGVGNDGQSKPPYDSTTQWAIDTQPTQGGNDMADASDVKHIYRYGPLGRTADASGLKHYTGKKTDFILHDMANSKEAKDKAAKRAQELKDLKAYSDKATQIAEDRLVEINRLRAELAKQPSTPSDPNSVTISKDGLWAVITNLFKKG